MRRKFVITIPYYPVTVIVITWMCPAMEASLKQVCFSPRRVGRFRPGPAFRRLRLSVPKLSFPKPKTFPSRNLSFGAIGTPLLRPSLST